METRKNCGRQHSDSAIGKRYRTTSYVRYIGELPEVRFDDDGMPLDVRSDVRFTWDNDLPFDVKYVVNGTSLFAVITVQVN